MTESNPNIWKNVYITILAGGSGTRFWPKSRAQKPKQLCVLSNNSQDDTMIEKTLKRISSLIPPERRLIVTHKDQLSQTQAIVKSLCPNYIAEPEAKNTAAALTAAAFWIEQSAKNSQIKQPIMVSLHADHIINNEEEFLKQLAHAIEAAQNNKLVLLGIKPTHPATGYGYIKASSDKNSHAFKVDAFKEKPDLDTAKSYLEDGNYYWNSGYFIWQTAFFLEELQKFLPHTVESLSNVPFTQSIPDSFTEKYAQLQNIAIDNALLEPSGECVVVPADIGWYDIGSWDAILECFGANQDSNFIASENSYIEDCDSTTVDTGDLFVAAIGLKDIVVAYHDGALLVCHKDKAQNVKNVVADLKKRKLTHLL